MDTSWLIVVKPLVHWIFFILGKSKEAEVKRINKELANIRSKFKGTMKYTATKLDVSYLLSKCRGAVILSG